MKKHLLKFGSVLAVILVLWGGYAYWRAPKDIPIITVFMISNTGKTLGTIDLRELNRYVLMHVKLEGLKPNSEHAIHIHEKGDCSPLKTFKNAGGHFNPAHKEHGLKNPKGHHAGDMRNLKADATGKVETNILNRSVTLQAPHIKKNYASLFDEDGSSIVIHLDPDDNISQPSGAAGLRIACGVIKMPAIEE